ncbi:MAG: hypothetical protein LBD02_07125 [Christensenellaceae bacterium]|jgi:hypothetical protein|nr:hypothetical protein [Christensenellaceae bacterium]
MQEMAYCPRCGTAAAGQYCRACGLRLAAPGKKRAGSPGQTLAIVLLAVSLCLSCFACSSQAIWFAQEKGTLRRRIVELETALQTPSPQDGPSKAGPPGAEDAQNYAPAPRPKPIPLGEAVDCSIDAGGWFCEFRVTVLETCRGEEAWERIEASSVMNRPPAEGKEYLLAKILIECTKIQSEYDEPLQMTKFDFNSVSSDYKASAAPSLILEGGLDVLLNEGESAKGWAAFSVEQGDLRPLGCLGNDIWLALSDLPEPLPQIKA